MGGCLLFRVHFRGETEGEPRVSSPGRRWYRSIARDVGRRLLPVSRLDRMRNGCSLSIGIIVWNERTASEVEGIQVFSLSLSLCVCMCVCVCVCVRRSV